jgi:WD40 repeat protein
MARFYRRQTRQINIVWIFLVICGALYTNPGSAQSLYTKPVLIADPGSHTSRIRSAAIADLKGIAITGSEDKTVRIWSLADGVLKHTIRFPEGPGHVGKIYAVAVSPESNLVAAGGWTSGDSLPESIYLFDPDDLTIRWRITGLDDIVNKLAFSRDGRFLAAAVGTAGLKIFDRDMQWAEVRSFSNYDEKLIYGLSFAPDGRLATASYDLTIRLYGPGPQFVPIAPTKRIPALPYEVAFSPDGTKLAVGHYEDGVPVDLLNGHTLEALPGPDAGGLNAKFSLVSWSRDGATLFIGAGSKLIAWNAVGNAKPRVLSAAHDTITSIATSTDGAILFAAADPLLKYSVADGTPRWEHTTPIADVGSQSGILSVSYDAAVVDFGYRDGGKPLIRFDMKNLRIIHDPSVDGLTSPPKRTGLPLANWENSLQPTFDGAQIELDDSEESRNIAIAPQNDRFLLGTTWAIRARDANNRAIWRRDTNDVWALNISGDGRYLVAAYDDGTIRWHTMQSGQELLALLVLPNERDWVAWTPEGYYVATPGAQGVLRWHFNNIDDEHSFGDAIPVSEVAGYRRADVLPLVLKTMDVTRAVTQADLLANRKAVQARARTKDSPGPTLHVLAIGINYTNSESLKLKFADKDAADLITAIEESQASTILYSNVKSEYLSNKDATQYGIVDQLDNLYFAMNSDDVAVVIFSGHGTMFDQDYYILPADINILTPAGIETKAISAMQLQKKVDKIAQRGRILVLIDACHSGAFSNKQPLTPNGGRLVAQASASNTTVLTSSASEQVSKEYPGLGHGAFAQALLNVFSNSADADANHDGLITVNELTEYLAAELRVLTNGEQTLGVSSHFTGNLFLAGVH